MSRSDRLLELLDQVSALTPDERGPFLDTACADDPQLRAKVEALLEEDEDAPEWNLDRPRALLTPLLSASHFPLLGERIGPWKLIQVLGEGGMGTVYLGERVDDAFTQQVAIKVVRSDAQRAPMLERFDQEQHIHAGLDHPAIAALLDAGRTEDNSPYFVMEYVAGERIDEYCENRDLPARARLELFLQVCRVVHDTHALGVVHRDLKPSNIMVQPSGKVKLLDFGVALVLGANEAQAEGELPFITPNYASPEGMQRQSITRASDQYSLGIILQELLTDRRPQVSDSSDTSTQEGTPDLDVRRLRRGTLARLSERSQFLKDFKAVLARAMAPNPRNRYASVLEFSRDLQRLLDGEMVLARTPSRREMLWRRTRQYRWPIAGVGLLCVLLIGSLAYAQHKTNQYETALERSERSRERASSHARTMERFAQRIMIALVDRLRSAPDSQAMREKLLSIGTDFFDAEPNRQLLSQELLATIINAHHQLGLLYTNPFEVQATQVSKARAAFAKAESMLPALAEVNAEWARSHQAVIHFSWGAVETQMGYLDRGWQRLKAAQEVLVRGEGLLAIHRSPDRYLQCETLLASNRLQMGDRAAALAALERVDAGLRLYSQPHPDVDAFGAGILHILKTDVALLWLEAGERGRAEAIYDLMQKDPWVHPGQNSTAQISNMVGQTQRIRLEWKLQKGWTVDQVLQGIDALIQPLYHENLEEVRFFPGLAELLHLKASVLMDLGRWEEARPVYHDCFRTWRHTVRMDPEHDGAKLALVTAMRDYISNARAQGVSLATLQTLIEEARAHLETLRRNGIDHPEVAEGIRELDGYFPR